MNGNNRITNSGFTFNASGDELSDGLYSYAWDAEGRMTSGASVTYTYDGEGERVKKSTGTLYWRGAGGEVLEETDTSGNLINDYIYFDGLRLGRIAGSGAVYIYYGDMLASEHTITDATGHVCYDADFYPFGSELAFTNTCGQNYEFAGMERDSETGLDHTMFRQYSSNHGRWMSPDPLGGDITNPQSLNRYAYVLNNPATLVDPLGLDGCNPGFIGEGFVPPPGFGENCGQYWWLGVEYDINPSDACAYASSLGSASCALPPGLFDSGDPIFPWLQAGGSQFGVGSGGEGLMSGDVLGPNYVPSLGDMVNDWLNVPQPQFGCEFGPCGQGENLIDPRVLMNASVQLWQNHVKPWAVNFLCEKSPTEAVKNHTIFEVVFEGGKGAVEGFEGGLPGIVGGALVGGFGGVYLGPIIGSVAATGCSWLGLYGN